MGSVGDAYENAIAESFFASLECELIDGRCSKTKAKAKTALFKWIGATVPTLNKGRTVRGVEHGGWTGMFVDRKVETPR
jgi:hypothetical protein